MISVEIFLFHQLHPRYFQEGGPGGEFKIDEFYAGFVTFLFSPRIQYKMWDTIRLGKREGVRAKGNVGVPYIKIINRWCPEFA
jgi:hypothetical protein